MYRSWYEWLSNKTVYPERFGKRASEGPLRYQSIHGGPALKDEPTKKKARNASSKAIYKSINRDKIFDNFKGDEDLVPFAIEAFMKDYPQRIREIEQGIKNDNTGQLAIAAHTLKGAVSNFFAPEAVSYAAHLERNAEENNLTEANQNFMQLKSEMKKVHKELETLLAEIS